MMSRNVTVIGCGHVGLVTAVGFAHLGHRVVGLDVKATLVETLSQGSSPFVEQGLEELLRETLGTGRLTFTTDYSVAVAEAEFIFLTVDTATTTAGAADLSNVRAATRSINANLAGRSPIIVNKSTSPVGSGETIGSILRAGLAAGDGEPRIVSNPEFLREGSAVYDFFNPDRIVVGSSSADDAGEVAELYGPSGPVFVTDLRTAEMIKYAANSYLATRISFDNEIARLCEALGTDVDDVLHGAGLDSRIGTHYFQPGLGYGGSCLPKDTAALRFVAELHGVTTPLLAAAESVNRSRPVELIRRLRGELGDLSGKRFGVWGVTFKGGTDDTRDSPALSVIRTLLNEEVRLAVFDPAAPADVPAVVAEVMVGSAIDAARDADALLVLTDWPEFKDVSLESVRDVMAGNFVMDGRNILDPAAVVAAGLTYAGMGRRTMQSDPLPQESG
jgi:UDPglucose 6-dehydrogenase